MSRPLELRTPLWFNTPMGPARAHFMITDVEQDILWVCFLHSDGGEMTGACRTFENQKIRLMDNETIGRITSGRPE